MPVTTTVQDIIDIAYSKSMMNRPGVIAAESTEMLDSVVASQRGLYSFAARVNPGFFGDVADVLFAAPGWVRPIQAESVTRIEAGAAVTKLDTTALPPGTEITVVPDDDRKAEKLRPSVYSYGQVYRPAGNTPDPVAGTLKFFFAKRPTDPTDLTQTLDALWVEQYNELLALDAALYLAVKDSANRRADEIQNLRNKRDEWVKLFIQFLEHEDAAVHRRWGHVRRINTQTLVPLTGLLAGGPVGSPSLLGRE